MITFALYTKQDISLAQILLLTAPKKIKILILNFNKRDQYNYPEKRKFLGKNLSKETIENIKQDFNKDKYIIVNSYVHYWWLIKQSSLHITKGLDIHVIKPKMKNLIILSQQRVFYSRLNMNIKFFIKKKLNIKIFMFSNNYFDKKIMNNWQLKKNQNDDFLLSKKKNLYGIDIYGHHYELLKKYSKKQIKSDFNIPLNKKIIFFSFRQAAEGYSMHDSSDEFMNSVKENLKLLRKQKYYIICRRRLSKEDIDYYKAKNQPIISRYHEIKKYIDVEINEDLGFPSTIWKLLYISDILYLSDMTNMTYLEAALCRCPIFAPSNQSRELLLNKLNNHAPPLIEMLDKKLIFQDLNVENIAFFNKHIEYFISKWYNTDIEQFWNVALKDH